MRLSWREIRARAARFAEEWAGQGYERGQAQLFWRDFFDIFGLPVRRVASFEKQVEKLGGNRGYIDLFWPGMLLVEQKSAGRDLKRARQQALDYLDGLKDSELPRYIVLSDFQSFEMIDLETGEETAFLLRDLPDNVEKFGFIIGAQKVSFRDEDPVNIMAAELMGKLYDALAAAGYGGHDLERFLVRILFCLFADDTGIFERDLFLTIIEQRTREDGSDVGPWLAQIFEVLNTPEDERQSTLDEDLARLPYVNGDLFAERLAIPAFTAEMRRRLIEVCKFDWSKISPAIFGSMFQSVMDPEERRQWGEHYTSEKNILKLIGPLFMDDLRAEFEHIRKLKRGRRQRLREFQEKLGTLTFFDPACGCGNFLVVAYRELRTLEIEVLKELHGDAAQLELDAQVLSSIDVNQFYGIELKEFPARIAETALWMMDHIMNNRLSETFGRVYVRIPLRASPNIRHADALEMDWAEVLPPERCGFVFGNPPFGGAKYQTPEQREQVRRIAKLGGSGGTLDYVAAWFIRAGEYLNEALENGAERPPRIAFVATSSICQGEQVAQLWPILFDREKLEIAYAHRPFKWHNEARGKAQVHVVIVGLDGRGFEPKAKRLFSYEDVRGEPVETHHEMLSPYLVDASRLNDPHLVVRESSRPLNGMPKLVIGSKPIDGGNYILKQEEYEELRRTAPAEAKWFRPYVGAREYINGGWRWIVHPASIPPSELKNLPGIRQRMAAVREYREKSSSRPTRELALTPGEFHVTVIPGSPFLVVPKVSSERREYVPIGWLEPPVVPSDLVFVLPNATPGHFALLTSAMHMAWLRLVGGRLEGRYRYSIGLVYNTFPVPPKPKLDTLLKKLEPYGRAVLKARVAAFAADPNATLADLYDPDRMPRDLRAAHRKLDAAVDKLYGAGKNPSDLARGELLLNLYEKVIMPVLAGQGNGKRKRRRRKR